MRSYRKSSHTVYDLKVHLIWITKYRYQVFEFPQLGKRYWGKHFWAIGYAAFSSGHVTDEMIQEYIAEHENHPNHNDDVFKVE